MKKERKKEYWKKNIRKKKVKWKEDLKKEKNEEGKENKWKMYETTLKLSEEEWKRVWEGRKMK